MERRFRPIYLAKKSKKEVEQQECCLRSKRYKYGKQYLETHSIYELGITPIAKLEEEYCEKIVDTEEQE